MLQTAGKTRARLEAHRQQKPQDQERHTQYALFQESLKNLSSLGGSSVEIVDFVSAPPGAAVQFFDQELAVRPFVARPLSGWGKIRHNVPGHEDFIYRWEAMFHHEGVLISACEMPFRMTVSDD